MPILQSDPLRSFTQEIFEACGAPSEEADIVANHLVDANLKGVDSHGVIRITQYVDDVRANAIIPGAPVVLCNETPTTAIVDGGWNFGLVVARRAMEVGMAKARENHIACVVTRRCAHAGRLGAYTQLAAQNGFIALAVCNSPRHGHFVLPWGGREGRLATNPISYGVPTNLGHPVVSDFSTAAAPEGKIRLCRDEGRPTPEGWIVDAQGNPTTNPADFYGPPMGAILPFGRESGYRGYALSLLVELLGSTLAGHDITVDRPGNDLAFIVINVEAFLPNAKFLGLLDQVNHYMKSSTPAEGFDEVLLPGEPEFRMESRRQREGIPVDDGIWSRILDCADSLEVKWPAEAGRPGTR
ncbi:MAG: Ldh family oxidoreductase [Acidobacteriota bacterium]|nr:Ldh family oxidoreductase [Acidobacteriota bacterium]